MTTQLTDADRDAMAWAITVARRESPTRAKQIDAKLRNEPFEAVGRFAAFSAQIASMHLQPWESTVVYADSREAHALLRRLKAAGLSKFEPDPIAALEQAGGNGLPGGEA
jgi:hypothetical protein